jgi:hypothetical protein
MKFLSVFPLILCLTCGVPQAQVFESRCPIGPFLCIGGPIVNPIGPINPPGGTFIVSGGVIDARSFSGYVALGSEDRLDIYSIDDVPILPKPSCHVP